MGDAYIQLWRYFMLKIKKREKDSKILVFALCETQPKGGSDELSWVEWIEKVLLNFFFFRKI